MYLNIDSYNQINVVNQKKTTGKGSKKQEKIRLIGSFFTYSMSSTKSTEVSFSEKKVRKIHEEKSGEVRIVFIENMH
jgi:predicted RNA-binding protein with PIN domain